MQNFLEAGHGKGAPNAVSGTLKRSADQLVRHGKFFPNARVLFEGLRESSITIKLYFVGAATMSKYDEMIEDAWLASVKGTLKIHQVISTAEGKLQVRDISCGCSIGNRVLDCPCYHLTNVTVLENQTTSDVSPDVSGTHELLSAFSSGIIQ